MRAGDRCLLIDCGFPLKETRRRLSLLEVQPEQITAILVTHEHGDHVAGVGALARRFDIPVWSTAGTARAGAPALGKLPRLHHFSAQRPFAVGPWEVTPVTVPHDAREPSQFTVEAGRRLGVLTDAGSVTPHMQTAFRGCDALILEFNHDEALLEAGDYPAALKARIRSRLGHLSNAQAVELLSGLLHHDLTCVVAAHISEHNNEPQRVSDLVDAVLDGCPARRVVAAQDVPSDWYAL